MKPRLDPVPLTPLDWEIWTSRWSGGKCARQMSRYIAADRRDAQLMLAWARGWPIDLGGDDENGECLFWKVK